jgi:hypothetical protein
MRKGRKETWKLSLRNRKGSLKGDFRESIEVFLSNSGFMCIEYVELRLFISN